MAERKPKAPREVSLVCRTCSKPFTYLKPPGAGRLRLQCSDECKPKPVKKYVYRYRPSRPRAAAEKLVTCECVVCGTSFSYEQKSSGRRRKVCSAECKSLRDRRELTETPCAECGKAFFKQRVSQNGRQPSYCSHPCFAKAQGRAARIHVNEVEAKRFHSHQRRARVKGARIERFSAVEVYERDGWICQLCGKRVDRRLRWPNKMTPSLDHIVSLKDGGEHSRRNTQLAHWLCNSLKGAKSRGQLRLLP